MSCRLLSPGGHAARQRATHPYPARRNARGLLGRAWLGWACLLAVASLAAPSCSGSGSGDSDPLPPTSSATGAAGGGGEGAAKGGTGGGGSDQGGGGAGPACVPYDVPTYQPAATDAAALSTLAEAAGYGSNNNSGWVAAAAGDFCGDGAMELALLKNSPSYLSVLRGPTPHAVAGSDLLSSASHPWRAAAAADLDNDGKAELVAVRHVTAAGVADVVVFDFDAQCAASVLASGVIGSASNSDWAGVAVADVDGDGTLEIVGLKQAHSNFVVMHLAGSSVVSEYATDLDSAPSHPWNALGAGDLDADGAAELIAARASSDGAPTVLAYRWSSGSFTKIADSAVGSNGNSSWAGATLGDFNGDGNPVLVLAKGSHTNFILLDLDGSATLASVGNMDLDSDPAQPWRALTAGDWLAGDQGADELIAVREASGAFDVDVLVYGNALHAARRANAIDHSLAQYAAGSDVFSDDAPPNVALLRERLLATHANTYSMLLWDTTGKDYLDLVEVLDGTRDFCVDGRALRIWVTLIPPTEAASRCSVPADSPLTDWDDRAPFDTGLGTGGCLDYPAWGEALGRLAAQYPHLVAVNVDDFSHNVGSANTFTPEVVARMTAGMRSQAPWLALAPTLYYRQSGTFVFDSWPDLGLVLDSVLFYFRNEKQGQGPCAAPSCDVPGSCTGACLAGVCADPTVANAPGEIADMATGLAAGRRLQLGVYASAHSQCGEATTLYVHELLATGLAQPAIAGATVYTFKYPAGDCPDPLVDKGCAVADVFGSQ